MINLLLITHANIASNLLDLTFKIYPESNINFSFVEIDCCDNKIYYQQKYSECMLNLSKLQTYNHNRCLILADLFGATPYNIAQKVAKKSGNYLISGVSLAMLLNLVNYCHNIHSEAELINFDKLAEALVQTTKESIVYNNYSNQKLESMNNTNNMNKVTVMHTN